MEVRLTGEALNARLRFAGKTRQDLIDEIKRRGKTCSANYISVALIGDAPACVEMRGEIERISAKWVMARCEEIRAFVADQIGGDVEVIAPGEGCVGIVKDGLYLGIYDTQTSRML